MNRESIANKHSVEQWLSSVFLMLMKQKSQKKFPSICMSCKTSLSLKFSSLWNTLNPQTLNFTKFSVPQTQFMVAHEYGNHLPTSFQYQQLPHTSL